MKNQRELTLAVLPALGLVLMLLLNANLSENPDRRDLSKAVFYVA